MSRHPLRHVWRAFVNSPASGFSEQAVFVEGLSYDDARARMLSVARLLHGHSPEWRDDAELFYNLKSFSEMNVGGWSTVPTLRVFETGWEGGPNGVTVSCWARDAIFVVRSHIADTLADAYAHLPRKGGTFLPAAWVRMSRAKSQAHPDQGREIAEIHAPCERIAAVFGKPDATLFDHKGPNWSIAWPDGMMARVFNWRDGKKAGVWHVASDDARALGRVACIVADATDTP